MFSTQNSTWYLSLCASKIYMFTFVNENIFQNWSSHWRFHRLLKLKIFSLFDAAVDNTNIKSYSVHNLYTSQSLNMWRIENDARASFCYVNNNTFFMNDLSLLLIQNGFISTSYWVESFGSCNSFQLSVSLPFVTKKKKKKYFHDFKF